MGRSGALAPSCASASCSPKPRQYHALRKLGRSHEKTPAEGFPPGFDGETSVRAALFAGREGALGAEHDGQDAVVLGRVGAGRTRALRLAEGERLPIEPSLDARVEHVDGETEASHRVPVVDHAHGPEVEAWIAGAGGIETLGDDTAAEQSAVDDRVAV